MAAYARLGDKPRTRRQTSPNLNKDARITASYTKMMETA